MKRKEIFHKTLAGLLAASMTVGMCPTTAFAVTGDQIAKDGTYTKTAHVTKTEDDVDDEWSEYDVTVSLTVKDGVFDEITVTPGKDYVSSESKTYFDKAVSKSKGFQTKLEKQSATESTIDGWDTVAGATRTSAAVKKAALEAIQEAEEAVKESEAESESKAESESESETVKETESKSESETETEAKEVVEYVLMNIPYDEFYAADVNNSVKVDAFSSATLNKTRTSTLAGGSYHVNSNGSEITGITFPVKVSEDTDLSKFKQVTDKDSVTISVTNRGQTSETTYTGKDALFENESYAYYVLSETPSFYKELTVNADGSLSFGATVGEVTTIDGVDAELLTETSYGDYQLNLDGFDVIEGNDPVYGVIIHTKEGASYGLRHLENIWIVTELAWSTGFTKAVHNCPTSSAHYEAMMGQTIDKITYYTAKGIYDIPVDVYVPVKFESTVKIADADAAAGSTTVTITGLPDDFDAVYSVEGLSVSVTGHTLSFASMARSAASINGQYTLTVTDQSGKYAPLSADFTLYTDEMPAAYNEDSITPALVAADGYDADELAKYLENIATVTVNGKDYAATGRGAVTIINADGTLKTDAAPFAEGDTFEISVSATSYKNDLTFTYEKEEYQYVYAGLTWAEYWASEDVLSAGSTESSDVVDKNGEYDKGAFDTVSRATTNHGLHRGSYQCMATIYMKDGTTYEIAYYTGQTTVVLTDGTEVTYNKSDIDHYVVTGLKYVPVKVATADYQAFCEAYHVVTNGDILTGGFSEQNLSAYTDVTAAVTASTNGLKTATKNADGTFSFSARTTGSDSGIENTSLKVATGLEPEVREANGSYGEFLRVDINGNYGDLAANMQAVKWTYYGDDSTYSKALASYGTKFAADNWMHKSMGIQLGLTDSLRCSLPEGTDGTGYWTLTIYALGYEDYTYQFKATNDNIVKEDYYVLMNIPYDAFYAADVNNSVKVDAFSSATLNKTRTSTLAGGSYHVNSDGSEITGITFPVKVSGKTDLSAYHQVKYDDSVTISVTNRGQTSETTYTGKDALFENESYAYYVLSETPSFYKELTVNADGSLSFGATVGEVTTIDGVDAELLTETSYGDYQLNLDGFDVIEGNDPVYGVIIHTKEGASYGLRHLENIWIVTELAWSTGFTKAVHNCPTSSAHYEAMMGQTIDKITYYTAKGIYDIPVDVYVPVKFEGTVEVADADAAAGSTTVTITGLPDDFDAVYSVEGLSVSVTGNVMTFASVARSAASINGQYTLTVTDQSGKYAPLSDDFILYTDEMPAAYNEDNSAPALVAAEGYDADELAKYLENIATVTVNGTSYAASGRGAVVIINADGTLKTDAAPFAEGDTFEISVSATSYKNDLTFTYTTKTAETENPGNGQDTDEETIDTSALQALITKAEALKQSDYTSASWEAMISTLEEAKGILEAKESQDSVDTAAKALQVAIDSLVKADKTSNSSNKTNSNSSSNKTTTKQSNKTNNLTSTTPKTGDPMNVAGMAAMAIASLGAGGFGLGLRRKSKKDKEA